MRHIAIYVRVSTKKQDHRSQLADLERWSAAQADDNVWYRDKFTGKTMDRPGWAKLWAAIDRGEVSSIVCWRLDRLGRTAAGLTRLFADLQERNVGLVSLKDGIDLSTPSGRMIANVLASIAQFETEVRGERIRAGQAAAKAVGKGIGGRKAGTRVRLTEEKEKAVHRLHKVGASIAEIARTLQLSRPTVYKALSRSVRARASRSGR